MVELEGTEIHEILSRPNPAQSYNTFIQEIIAFGKLTGNRYIYGIQSETGNSKGRFLELYVLPSQVMEIHSGGIMQPVKEYSFQYNGTHRIPAEQILHIKDFNPYYDGTGSHLYGMSPLQSALRSLDSNNEATTTGLKYLQNQTARGVLMSEEGDLTETQARQLKDKFRNQYQGSSNAGDVIITPKKLSWINFGLNASDLSLIDQYNASIKDLCNIYNVPVQLLNNTESSTYNNMKEAKKALYQNAVIPELIKIREELNRWLTPKYGEKLYIDFDFSVVPELQEEMEKVVGQMASAWWLTPNEKRVAMSYGVDEQTAEMENYFVPSNLIPLESNMNEDFPLSEVEKSLVIGATDMFTTIGEAMERAEQMGGSGYHEHIFRGSTVFMPFPNHEMYEAAKSGKMQEFIDENSHHYDDEENDEFIEKLEITARVRTAINNKVDDHNEKHGDDPKKRVTYTMLAQVFRRGVGAYNTNPQSVRPSVSSADQWAYARINSFLYAVRNGKFRSGKHDTDLFPSGHPLSSKKKEQKAESFNDYPQGASNNARRMLDWREKYGRDVVKGGTEVGWKRANQIASRSNLSLDVVKRVHSFLSRHKENATIAEEYKNEPWKDRGYVAYNLWGGAAMVNWAKKISEQGNE